MTSGSHYVYPSSSSRHVVAADHSNHAEQLQTPSPDAIGQVIMLWCWISLIFLFHFIIMRHGNRCLMLWWQGFVMLQKLDTLCALVPTSVYVMLTWVECHTRLVDDTSLWSRRHMLLIVHVLHRIEQRGRDAVRAITDVHLNEGLCLFVIASFTVEIDCSDHITSHHITSHHITSHHITSHHITSHHITSHHITSHHSTIGRAWNALDPFSPQQFALATVFIPTKTRGCLCETARDVAVVKVILKCCGAYIHSSKWTVGASVLGLARVCKHVGVQPQLCRRPCWYEQPLSHHITSHHTQRLVLMKLSRRQRAFAALFKL